MKKDRVIQLREKIPRKVKCDVLGAEEKKMLKEVLKKERKVSNRQVQKVRGHLNTDCGSGINNAMPNSIENNKSRDEPVEMNLPRIQGLSNSENGIDKDSEASQLKRSGLSHFMELEERKDLLMTNSDDDPLCINGPEAYDAVGWVPIKQEFPDDVEVSRIIITEIPLKSVEEPKLPDPVSPITEIVTVADKSSESKDETAEITTEQDALNDDDDDGVESSSTDDPDSSWWSQDDESYDFKKANGTDASASSRRKTKPYVCDICEKTLSSKGSFRIHKKKKHKIDMRFSCELCVLSFDLQRDLIKHRNESHRDANGRFGCKDCGKCFSDYRCFLVHMKTHYVQREVFNGGGDEDKRCFKCKECDKVFYHEENLSLHKVMTHNSGSGFSEKLRQHEKNFVCDTCGKRFAFSCLLKDHMNLHTGAKPYLCQLCGRSFAQKASLKQHMLTHSSVRPFTCNVCNQGFFGHGDLKKHMRKHTGERPYVCEVCGDGFSQSSHLSVHRRSHTGERPFECDVCSRGFTKKGDVVRHRRIHTGELPYLCQVCGKAFRQSTQCSNHIKNHHPGTPVAVSKNPAAVSQWSL